MDCSYNARSYSRVAFIAILLAGVVLSYCNYLVFHTVVELYTIIVSCIVALIVYNTYRTFENNFFLVLGISFAFSGLFDFIHTLAYPGIGIFPNAGNNLAPQMWLIARFIDSASLLAASSLMFRTIRPVRLLIFGGCLSLALLSAVFVWDEFPVCFVEGSGLTPFKIISEYIISALIGLAIIGLIRNRRSFHANVYDYLLASYLMTIVSELSFTLYDHMYGFSNMIGHLSKFTAYYFLYRAIVKTSLKEPHNLLFYKITKTNEQLQQKTLELDSVNRQLQYISYHDGLTGLYNRSYFEKFLKNNRHFEIYPVCVVALDVDGLKLINDNLGHQTGDELIRATADLLQQSFRDEDIIARLGGDEFIVILPQTSTAKAQILIEKFEENVKSFNAGNTVPVFVSVGCAAATEHDTRLDELYRKADSYMYACKQKQHRRVKDHLLKVCAMVNRVG